ncbi:MAG: hypothetical protein WBF33_17905 [Candidatus Nitrosopolaris sp.]
MVFQTDPQTTAKPQMIFSKPFEASVASERPGPGSFCQPNDSDNGKDKHKTKDRAPTLASTVTTKNDRRVQSSKLQGH